MFIYNIFQNQNFKITDTSAEVVIIILNIIGSYKQYHI